MNQPVLFCSRECACHLVRDIQHRGDRQRSLSANTRFERFAFDQFHSVKTLAGWSFAEMKHGRDIRVTKLRSGARFTSETLARFRIAGKPGADHLQRDRRTKVDIDGVICNPHRAASKFPQGRSVSQGGDFVMLEPTIIFDWLRSFIRSKQQTVQTTISARYGIKPCTTL